jgi:crossover junction endodeoxyribonuclease RuvC
MKVLGIDPGYERLGISILEKVKGKEILIYSNCFKTSAKEKHSKRLSQIQKEIQKIIEEHRPKHLAIEKLFFNSNVKTAILVAEARGVVISSCATLGLDVFEYSPQEIKIAVTGHGKSDKKSVSRMVKIILNPKKEIKSDDEFDAIACAMTHLASFR